MDALVDVLCVPLDRQGIIKIKLSWILDGHQDGHTVAYQGWEWSKFHPSQLIPGRGAVKVPCIQTPRHGRRGMSAEGQRLMASDPKVANSIEAAATAAAAAAATEGQILLVMAPATTWR